MITHKSASRSTGFAALYLAAALVAAMIYFLVGTDYPSVTDPVAKVDLLLQNQFGIHVMYLIAYVGFGLALSVLALGLQTKLAVTAPAAARVGAAIGLLWAGMLVASGVVYIVGMASVVDLPRHRPGSGRHRLAGHRTGRARSRRRRRRGSRWDLGTAGESGCTARTPTSHLADLAGPGRRRCRDRLHGAGSGRRGGRLRTAGHRVVRGTRHDPAAGAFRDQPTGALRVAGRRSQLTPSPHPRRPR